MSRVFKSYVFRSVMLIWVLLSLAALGTTLYLFDGRPDSDVDTLLVYSMLLLSFPSGLLVVLGYSALSFGLYSVFSIVVENSYVSLSLSWLAFFTLGYIQWFKLLPYFLERSRMGVKREEEKRVEGIKEDSNSL